MHSCEPFHMDEQKIRRLARTYLQLLCADTGCSLEDLLGAMDDRVSKEGQGNLCEQYDMMMMMMCKALHSRDNIGIEDDHQH